MAAASAAPRLASTLLAAAVALLGGAARPASAFDVRVSKGFYSRPYDTVRLSVISGSPVAGAPLEPAPDLGPSAYKSQFVQRWTSKVLQSELVNVGAAGTTVKVGEEEVHLKLPAPGTGVTGIFFSDPCFTSRGGFRCPNGRAFKILDRLTEILNRLLSSDEFDFWGILGDNFYDIMGGVSSEFFGRLTTKAKSKPFLTAIGNHDFWLSGSPPGTAGDDLGYGFMQFYGQDTVAGLGPKPYDFSGDPNALQIARAENFIFGTQLGDLAFFGYSAAHDWPSTLPHATAFCAFAGREPTVHAVVLLGHWDECNLGCIPGMDTPSVYKRMRALPGCDHKRMFFFVGHQHCNRVVNGTGPTDANGFMIGGVGMYGAGCSQFGFTVLQSHPGAVGGPNVRVDYFPIAAGNLPPLKHGGHYMDNGYPDAPLEYDRFDALSSCLNRSGYAGCRREHGFTFRALTEADACSPQPLATTTTSSSTTSGSSTSATTSTSPVATSTATTTTATSTTTTTTTTATTTTIATTATATTTTTTTTTIATTTTATATTATATSWTRTTTRSMAATAPSSIPATSSTSPTAATTATTATMTTSTAAPATTTTCTTTSTPTTVTSSTATSTVAATTTLAATTVILTSVTTSAAPTSAAATETRSAVVTTAPGSNAPTTKESTWLDSLDIWATTSAAAARASMTTTRPATAATTASIPSLRTSSAAATTTMVHNCWAGLLDATAMWSPEKADWCCRRMNLGCNKRAITSTALFTLHDETTTPQQRGLDKALQGKPKGPAIASATDAVLDEPAKLIHQ